MVKGFSPSLSVTLTHPQTTNNGLSETVRNSKPFICDVVSKIPLTPVTLQLSLKGRPQGKVSKDKTIPERIYLGYPDRVGDDKEGEPRQRNHCRPSLPRKPQVPRSYRFLVSVPTPYYVSRGYHLPSESTGVGSDVQFKEVETPTGVSGEVPLDPYKGYKCGPFGSSLTRSCSPSPEAISMSEGKDQKGSPNPTTLVGVPSL